MGKNSAPSAPKKPNSNYKIGDRTVANATWNGNDYDVTYNPTSYESQAMNYIQNALPQAYKDAFNGNNISNYKNNWINNQVKQYNELADKNLTNLKDSLITGGQVGGSTGWNQIKTFLDSYNDTLSDISANADYNALNYQNALLDYANKIQNSMNNYYSIAQNTAAANQNTAWNQSVQDYQNRLQEWQANQANGNNWATPALGLVGSIGGSVFGGPIGGAIGGAIGNSLAKKTGGSN